MRWLCLIVALLTLLALPPALAVEPDEILSDPALEARARTLSKELRCMVCQNQSIDDLEAPLARDVSYRVALAVALQAQREGLAEQTSREELEACIRMKMWTPVYRPYRRTFN
jgi:cytochrome c-type biogenesis protein CcmH/NrfF